MCGFTGFVENRTAQESRHILQSMLSSMSHRGPDGEGLDIRETASYSVCLGHRRLAIIDVNGGAQPMADTNNRLHIVFNGEIINFIDLKKQLGQLGHTFATNSDTEVILKSYVQWGTESFEKLNGMFAFALWDDNHKKLFLVRDRSSIKPLFFSLLKNGGLVFGSELTALLKHPLIEKKISRPALVNYLFYDAVPSPEALIEGVQKLAPGTYLQWQEGKLQLNTFYSINNIRIEEIDEDKAIQKLDSILNDSVSRYLISDVPLGIFLSGGIDSSLVAAIAQKKSAEPLHSFSIGFEDSSFDESPYARQVAKHIGANFSYEIFSEAQILIESDNILSLLDEPLADPSLIPTYLLSKLAKSRVKVALGGDGGDELWAGYPSYQAHKLAENFYNWIPNVAKKHIIKKFVDYLPFGQGYQSIDWKLRRFVNRWESNILTRNLRYRANCDLGDLAHIFSGPQAPKPSLYQKMTTSQLPLSMEGVLAQDFLEYLPIVLTKVDRASMAVGLEVRPPFLDNESISLAFSLPLKLKLRNNTTKYLLKKVASKYLPENIIYRRKQGFGIPLLQWTSGALQKRYVDMLNDTAFFQNQGLNLDVIRSWNHETLQLKADHSRALWAFYVLWKWFHRVTA